MSNYKELKQSDKKRIEALEDRIEALENLVNRLCSYQGFTN